MLPKVLLQFISAARSRSLRLIPIVAFVAAPQLSHAYFSEVHYWLTYFAARVTGYTEDQAHRIALADVSVDAAGSPTDPVPHGIPTWDEYEARVLFHAFINDNPNHALTATRNLPAWSNLDWNPSPQNGPRPISRRIWINSRQPNAAYSAALRDVLTRQRNLTDWCLNNGGNPGVLLHFAQDRFSHAGYGADVGQAVSMPGSPLLPHLFVLPGGTLTDYPGFDQRVWGESIGLNYGGWIWYSGDRDKLMVRETLRILRQFAKRPGMTGELPNAEALCLQLLKRIESADPPNRFWDEGKRIVDRAWSSNPWELPKVYVGSEDPVRNGAFIRPEFGPIVSEELAKLGLTIFENEANPYQFALNGTRLTVLGQSGPQIVSAMTDPTQQNPLDSFAIFATVTIGISKPMMSTAPEAESASSRKAASGAVADRKWTPFGGRKAPSKQGKPWKPYASKSAAKGRSVGADISGDQGSTNGPKRPVSVTITVASDTSVPLPIVIRGRISQFMAKPLVVYHSQPTEVKDSNEYRFEAVVKGVPMCKLALVDILYDDGSHGGTVVSVTKLH